MSRWNLEWREPALVLVAIVAFCSIHANWLSIRAVPASDFYQFWVVGRELAEGRAGDIYSQGERERIGERYLAQMRSGAGRTELYTARQRATLETFSTPFLYSVFGSFSSGDYEDDLMTYRVLSMASALIAIALLCRLLGYGTVSIVAAVALFGSWFAPTRSDWFVGNVNGFQLACLAVFLWISSRFPSAAGYVLGGFLLGLSAMFKPNAALVMLSLFAAWGMRRRRRKLVFASLGTIVAMLLAFVWSSVAFRDVSIWRSWFLALAKLPDDIISVELGNYAPARLVTEWIGVDASSWMAVVFGGLLLAVMLRALWGPVADEARERAGLEDLHVVALAGLVTLLSSPLSWLHYFVATIPMLLIGLGPAPKLAGGGAADGVSRILVWIALLGVMMRPLVLLELGDDRSRAILLCIGTLLLFALGLRSLLGFGSASQARRELGR